MCLNHLKTHDVNLLYLLSYILQNSPSIYVLLPTKITDISMLNSSLAQYTDYSSEEVPIGKWIDGSTIYRKIIQDTTGGTSGTAKKISIGSTISKLINMYGDLVTSSNSLLPINFYLNNTNYIATSIVKNDNTISIQTTFTSRPITIILEYLK